MHTLLGRLAVLAVVIAGFSVGMALLLIVFKVQGTHNELRHGRFALVAQEVDTLVERSLSLGVPFDELPQLQAALIRQKSVDLDILSIDVLHANGVIVYSSEPARVGTTVPSSWQQNRLNPAPRANAAESGTPSTAPSQWRVDGSESRSPAGSSAVGPGGSNVAANESVAGVSLINGFGQVFGYAAVRYSREAGQRAQRQVRDAIMPLALQLFALSSLVLLGLLAACTWRVERDVQRAAQRLAVAGEGDGQHRGNLDVVTNAQSDANSWAPIVSACDQQLRAATEELARWRGDLQEPLGATLDTPVTTNATSATMLASSPQRPPRHHPARLVMVASLVSILVVVATSIGILGWSARQHVQAALSYETLRKTESVAQSLARSIERAAALSIPLSQLPGIAERFDEVRARHPEISRISLTIEGIPSVIARAAGSEHLVETLVETAAVPSASGTSERLEVAVDPRFMQRMFNELTLDFVVIVVVAAFVTLELIYLLAGAIIVSPLRTLLISLTQLSAGVLSASIPARFGGALAALARVTRARQDAVLIQYAAARRSLREALADRQNDHTDRVRLIGAVLGLRQIRDRYALRQHAQRNLVRDPQSALGSMRAPFFLLLLAEDLSRSFLPLYAGQMQVGSLHLPATWVVGLPIFLFMLIVAISQPVLGGWTDRVGRRRAFLIAAGLGVVAHLLTAQAETLTGLLAWRAAAGAAWAIAFVAAQGIVLDFTDQRTRATGLASFVTVIMVSMVCGPSIGGLLADGLGQRATFITAAGLCGLSLLVAWKTLPHAATRARAAAPSAGMPLRALANPKLMGLLLLAAAPAKLLLVATCFYLLPLYLNASGNSAATAGRIIMIYSVFMVLLVPFAAMQAGRLQQRYGSVAYCWFVLAGLVLSGVGGFAILIPHALWGAVLMVGLLGIAQATSISPQAALVPVIGRDAIATYGESAVYGCYRLVERIGSAVGPLLAAALLHWGGYRETFVALSSMMLACAAFFAWRFVWRAAGVSTVQPCEAAT